MVYRSLILFLVPGLLGCMDYVSPKKIHGERLINSGVTPQDEEASAKEPPATQDTSLETPLPEDSSSEQEALPELPVPEEKKPGSVLLFGDSLNLGVFADTALNEPLTAQNLENMITLGLRFFRDQDSLTKEELAVFQKTDLEPYLGSGITNSIKNFLDLTGQTFSFSQNGATTADLPELIERYKEEFPQDAEPVSDVFISLGNNDFCQVMNTFGPGLAQFKQELTASYKNVMEEFPNAKIYLENPLPIDDLPEVTEGLTAPMPDMYKPLAQCRLILPAYCPTLSAVVLDKEKRMKDIRKAFHDAACAASEQAGRKDIQYVDFSEFALTPSYLAADCFHGSMAGSEAVAQYYKDKLAPLQCDDQEEQNDEVL